MSDYNSQPPKEDIAATLERKRREFVANEDKQGTGTLGGFLAMLKKRREATDQSADDPQKAAEAMENAK